MMQKACSILLVGLLMGCSGGPGSTFNYVPRSDASGGAASDATSDGSQDSAAEAALVCPATCPATEPAAGDPCDLGEDCEYGDSLLVECNRVYFCSLGHFQKWMFDDAGVCATPLTPGCPATRAAAIAAVTCSSADLRCGYMEGECDCVQSGGQTVWHCFPDNPLLGSQAHCVMARPRLGTSCPAQSVTCQYESICQAEACTACGQWAMVPFSCPNGGPAPDGGVTPDAGVKPDAARMSEGGGMAEGGGPPPEAGTKHDSGKDGH